MDEVNKDTYGAFLGSVLEKVPADRREQVSQLFEDPAIAPVLRDSVLARSDYSRAMDAISRDREALETETEEARRQIAEWQEWYTAQMSERTTLDQELQTYKEQFGNLEDSKVTTPAAKTTPDFDWRQELANRDQLAIKFADMLTDIKIKHHALYGEVLDSQGVIDYASKRGLRLDVAYNELVAPRVKARAEEDLKAALDKARQEGRQEVLTEHHLPVGPPRPTINYGLDKPAQPRTSQDRVAAAVAQFNSAIR